MKKNINEMKEALFVIDMNNGFCNEGNLADKGIKRIVPYIIKLIEYTNKKKEGVFFVNDKHTKDSVELKRYNIHCHNELESQTIDELMPYQEMAAKVFYKNSTCALFAPGMMEMLKEMKNLKTVTIVGCCTDICIQNFAIALRNFFDELNMDVDIVVPIYGVDTFNISGVHDRNECNKEACKLMENNGIKLERTLRR